MIDSAETLVAIGVDIPIGLPDRTTGGRSAERAARRLLGRAGSSVFPVPPCAAVYADSYDEAKHLALAHSEPPKAVSRQTYQILPALREVDGLLRARPELRERLHEVHPEVAFHRLHGGRPLNVRKREPGGAALRRELLDAPSCRRPLSIRSRRLASEPTITSTRWQGSSSPATSS